LRGYFDGDGNVSVSRSLIRASSSSEQLIDGIALLLTRFGIFSTKLKNKQFCIAIPYKYAKIFKDKIGFTIPHKKEGLEAICKKNKQDYIDMIGGFGDILYNAAKKLGYPTRYVNNFTKRQKIGRSTLAKYVRIFEKLSMKKDIVIEKELSIMKRMLNSDVVWDEITHISYIKPSSEYVYDITVEGTETFTTFDGIITHNTMRSYTLASQSDRLSKVTQGLPRLIEIFDARKTFEKNMTIYLKPKYNTREGAKAVANKIKSTKLKDKLVSDSIDLMNTRIELELSDESDRDVIKTKIEKQFKKSDVTYRGKKLYVTPHDTETKNLRKIRNKLLDMHISGVKHIEEIIVVKEGDDWILQTSGSNLKKVLEMEEVDIKRTTTNDIYQVYEILGIEAARNVILQEAKETLDEQGLDVDIRHLIILADTMTANGKISAIGRYGVSGRKVSVLARANFEETKKHIVNASFYGENDTLDGIIENVMVGQITPVGTGMVDLIVDVEKMKKSGKK
jgi:DNA-directed RNA polymerase subunit A"